MTEFRYSASSLLSATFAAVLFLGSLTTEAHHELRLSMALRGLSLCTFLFLVMCGLFGHSAIRGILLSFGFYVWGAISLLLTDYSELGLSARLFLAIAGGAYFLWSLMDDGSWKRAASLP